MKGEGGQSALELGVKLLLSVLGASQLPGCEGGRGASQLPGCEGGMGASQLWSWVVVSSSVFFRGDGGESALELGGGVVGFFFRGDGGQSASGCEGGMGASQLWSWVVVSSVFFFGGTGASQLPGL